MDNIRRKLLKRVNDITRTDKKFKEEADAIRKSKKAQKKKLELELHLPVENEVLEFAVPNGVPTVDLALETIVLRTGRPVLAIYNDEATFTLDDAESEVWHERLTLAKPGLVKAAKAIGRIELFHDPVYQWVGTGWLVNNNIIVTNRHVANIFSMKSGSRFVFRQGIAGRKIEASIDFIEEAHNSNELVFKITDVLHVEENNGPDLALLRVETSETKTLADCLTLSAKLPSVDAEIAVIGYPARDSRIPEQQLMLDIFGDIYNKKRLAPGTITHSSSNMLLHDCSTLGGNSGSPLIDLQTGEVVGLHFAGRFLEANYAVPATVIKDRINRVSKSTEATAKNSNENRQVKAPAAPISNQINMANHQQSISIPLVLNISIAAASQGHPVNKQAINLSQNETEAEEFYTEAAPEDYENRTGYDAGFLGDDLRVPLPAVTDTAITGQVLEFNFKGEKQQILDYTHFSVLMSEPRRMCIYSAVNIDGKTSVSMKRGPWRTDPRIKAHQQIMKECYGNAPKFSRGHMTRREDPIWGNDSSARLGNADSMHVTNAVPQMQDMNAGIWLKLENYALQNARKDDMRISVFTGPVFSDNDPEKYGVKIPLAFWKVIAFIHDETGQLCATGYRISQEGYLQEEEYIFGEHGTDQVSIASIEAETGLSFGALSQCDPFETGEESIGGPLVSLHQVRFI